ncbi:MAG TPA: hypothetical protein VJ804_10240 [Acidimicrobiales bacterium]|nr:hypothetical protein [Acidimicrobiales bacterium]
MEWVFLGVGVVLVFAIAAAFVGSEAFRLGHETPAAIFDVDEAVEDVGDRLPVDVQGRLSYEEVRTLIVATLAHLRAKGLTALPGDEIDQTAARPEVVVADDDAVAVVLGAVEAHGLDVADEDAVEVITALLGHLRDIGALGPRA